MQAPFVEVRDLVFSRNHRNVLDGIHLSVLRGQIVAIMGPSGSGKTSLLRLIGGMLRPDSGQVFIGEQNIHELSFHKLQRARQNMGFLFQSNSLFTDLSVFENVAFPLREHTRLSNEEISKRVLEKLHAVGLRRAAFLMPASLSGGMARRVALARALILEPEFMMYDEPFTGQDPISMGVLSRLISETNSIHGTTSLVVSHDVDETCEIADYIYLLSQGRIIAHGKPCDLKDSLNPAVSQFMRGEADGVVPFHYGESELSQEEEHAQ